MPDHDSLTEAETDRLSSDGYVVRESVFDAREVGDIGAACETLVDNLVRNRKGERVRFGSYVFDSDMTRGVVIKWEGASDVVHGIEPFAHLSPALESWGQDRRFIAPMRTILGHPEPMLFTEKLNLKRPRHGGANPLHQDYPYWLDVAEDPAEVATAMLFLDDSTLDNGCLHVVPGSHRLGQWQTRTDGDHFASNEIDAAACADVDLVPLEVASGSIVLFGSLLVHQSAPNRSDRDRRALLYSYQPAGRRTMIEAMRRHRI